jgi:hypothetical protein
VIGDDKKLFPSKKHISNRIIEEIEKNKSYLEHHKYDKNEMAGYIFSELFMGFKSIL